MPCLRETPPPRRCRFGHREPTRSEVRVSSQRPAKEKPARRAGSASPAATHHPHKRQKRRKTHGEDQADRALPRGARRPWEGPVAVPKRRRGEYDGTRRASPPLTSFDFLANGP